MKREQLRTVLVICALKKLELDIITPKSLNDYTGFIMSCEGHRYTLSFFYRMFCVAADVLKFCNVEFHIVFSCPFILLHLNLFENVMTNRTFYSL